MKKNFTLLLFISLWLFLIYSCEKIIDIDIPERERKIVLNSLITPDSLIKIHLSESESILKAGFSMDIIENATVQLYENNSFAALLLYTGEGCYVSSDFYPREESQYRVEVSVPGKDPVSSSVLIPDTVKIISIDTNIISSNKEWAELQVRLKFVDPKEIDNYYIVKAKTFGRDPINPALSGFGPMNVYLESESPIISKYGKPEGGLVFSDKLIDGSTYELSFDLYFYPYGSDSLSTFIHFYLQSISESYYYYVVSKAMQEELTDNPFAEPVQVYNNIEGGLGIFGAYSSSVDSFRLNFTLGTYPIMSENFNKKSFLWISE